MTDDLLKRLLQPPFGTETSERNLMAEAAAQLEAANARASRARDDALVEAADIASKAMRKYAISAFQNDEGRMQNAARTYCADEIRVEIQVLRTQPSASVEPVTVQEKVLPVMENKVIKEGKQKRGGLNETPSEMLSRPSPPQAYKTTKGA